MLRTSTYYPQHIYTPPQPSPLSERSANAAPHIFSFSMASQPPSQEKKPIIPQRPYKQNPVMQTRDAATKRRRDMFFRRVQKERDDRKWEARGEQIQRLDYISDQKRWEAEKAREAPQSEPDYIDEETWNEAVLSNVASSAPRVQEAASEADYILAQEEYELQQLIASMEEETVSQHYGSDDEDYDQLFMECTNGVVLQHQLGNTSANFDDADAMDMTEG